MLQGAVNNRGASLQGWNLEDRFIVATWGAGRSGGSSKAPSAMFAFQAAGDVPAAKFASLQRHLKYLATELLPVFYVRLPPIKSTVAAWDTKIITTGLSHSPSSLSSGQLFQFNSDERCVICKYLLSGFLNTCYILRRGWMGIQWPPTVDISFCVSKAPLLTQNGGPVGSSKMRSPEKLRRLDGGFTVLAGVQ